MIWVIKSPAGKVLADTPANAQAEWATAKAGLKPGETATKHICQHQMGEPQEQWYNCMTDARAQFESHTQGPPA